MTLHGVGEISRAEDDLWAAAVRGDGRAFAVLFDEHYDRVFRHVVGFLDSPADADEVAASSFLELWRRRDAVRLVNGSLLPWLLVTAVNLARNQRRRSARYGRLIRTLVDEHERQHADPAVIAEAAAVSVEDRNALGAALRRLKLVDAQLIVLTTMGDLSIVAAAETVGISAGAARVRLHRARQRLRELIPNPYVKLPVEEESA